MRSGDDYDPNEKFYLGIEREAKTRERTEHIHIQFQELCLQNNYTVKYTSMSRRNQHICTMQIKAADGSVRYHLTSDVIKTTTEDALLNVMSKIVTLSKQHDCDEKRPPFANSGRNFTPERVNSI